MEIRSDCFIGLEFHIILDSRWRTLDALEDLEKQLPKYLWRSTRDSGDEGQHDDKVKVKNL